MRYKAIILASIFFLITGCVNQKSSNQTEKSVMGEELYSKYACATCHSFNGDEMYGPTLNGIYQKEVQVIQDGEEKTLTVNRNYLMRSIVNPDYEKLKGFEERTMPVPDISKKEINILIDYIVSFSEE